MNDWLNVSLKTFIRKKLFLDEQFFSFLVGESENMINNYYTNDEKELFLNNESKLVFSKNYRRLNQKTQLFSTQKGDHFRSRMVHTEEVRVIALQISNKINKKLNQNLIDLNLVSCISIAHDFGHTPFGHVGERALQNILKKTPFSNDKLFFKHNINSMRLLIQEFSKDIPWQILDGVLKHSKLNYDSSNDVDISFITAGTEYDGIFYSYKKENEYLPLTLEGQIVAIADEIAQRYSDFEDTFRAKNINSLSKILKEIHEYTENDCKKYIDRLLLVLINSVVSQSCKNIEELNFNNKIELRAYLAKNSVITFDKDGFKTNQKIDDFIKECIESIDELRCEDEKNKYIINKLFESYYNNCHQINGKFYHNFISNIYAFISKIKFNEETENDLKYKQICNPIFFNGSSRTYNIKKFKEFIENLKQIEFDKNAPEEIIRVYNFYLQQIVYYIASMTDKYAIQSYHYLYGIK